MLESLQFLDQNDVCERLRGTTFVVFTLLTVKRSVTQEAPSNLSDFGRDKLKYFHEIASLCKTDVCGQTYVVEQAIGIKC